MMYSINTMASNKPRQMTSISCVLASPDNCNQPRWLSLTVASSAAPD